MSDESVQPSDASDAADINHKTEAPERPLSFMERARQAAGQAASTAAKVTVDVGTQAAKAGADLGGKAAKAAGDAGEKAVTTIRDPATKARAQSALKKAKRGFTTALERIDPRILADVVVKATSLQERANISLKERGSVYRIGEISIGASIPPSIHFAIVRVEDPDNVLTDSQTLLENATAATIVSLDGTAVEGAELEELEDED
jgi:hypothetical protein